jgi:hypothetical protein
MPRQITAMFSSQKNTKQTADPAAKRPQAGHKMRSMALMACPPIQVWMPNQPQATSARRMAGTFAPSTPNGARTSTGNGMPYLAPACAFSSIGTSTIRLPSRMVPIACHQFMPPAISPEASM